jgi:hypothetical protein
MTTLYHKRGGSIGNLYFNRVLYQWVYSESAQRSLRIYLKRSRVIKGYIRKKRARLRSVASRVAARIGVTASTPYWEGISPQIHQVPAIVAFLGRNPATAATEIFPEKLANARPYWVSTKGHGKPSKNRSDKSDERGPALS